MENRRGAPVSPRPGLTCYTHPVLDENAERGEMGWILCLQIMLLMSWAAMMTGAVIAAYFRNKAAEWVDAE